MNLPQFRYHPDPLRTGSIQRRNGTCVCCGRDVEFLYVASVYSVQELGGKICPWCVADGNAHLKFDVEEAKELARQELAKRGLSEISTERIEQVKADVQARRAAAEEYSLRSLETDEEIPSWRKVARARVAPYRQILSLAALVLMGVSWLNSIYEWELLNLNSGQSEGLALLIVLVWLFFVAPTRSEFRKLPRP